MTVYLSVAGLMAQGLYSTALTPPVIQNTAQTMLILPAAMYMKDNIS